MASTLRAIRGVLLDQAPPLVIAPLVQTLRIARATDLVVDLSVLDGSTGIAADLAGALVVLTIRSALTDSSPILAREGVITNAAGGLVAFTFVAAELELVAGSYFYDVIVTLSSLRSQVVPVSAFVVDGSASHPEDATSLPAPTNTYRVLLDNRGVYSGVATYTAGQVVTYGGETFVALVTTTGTAPVAGTTNSRWQLLAQRGDAGAAGAAAFGLTTVGASFVQPAVGASVSVLFGSTVGMYAGMMLVIDDGTAFAGVYRIASVTDATHAVVVNMGLSAIAPTATFSATRATVAGGRFYNLGPIGLVGASNGAGDFAAPGVKAGDVILSIIDTDGGLFQKTVGPTAASDFRAGALADDTLHQFNAANWSAVPFVYGLLRFLF